jgi:predicted transcriptional regulator
MVNFDYKFMEAQMRIDELLGKKELSVETIKENDELASAVRVMNEKRIGALIVLDEAGDIAGIISERDLLMVCSECAPEIKVKQHMTPKSKLITLKSEDTLRTSMKIFTDKNIRHLPVLENGKLVGIISIRDVVRELLQIVEEENKHLKEYVMG